MIAMAAGAGYLRIAVFMNQVVAVDEAENCDAVFILR